jgi:hypothetical protein
VRLTTNKVLVYLSSNNLEPDVAPELFILDTAF